MQIDSIIIRKGKRSALCTLWHIVFAITFIMSVAVVQIWLSKEMKWDVFCTKLSTIITDVSSLSYTNLWWFSVDKWINNDATFAGWSQSCQENIFINTRVYKSEARFRTWSNHKYYNTLYVEHFCISVFHLCLFGGAVGFQLLNSNSFHDWHLKFLFSREIA